MTKEENGMVKERKRKSTNPPASEYLSKDWTNEIIAGIDGFADDVAETLRITSRIYAKHAAVVEYLTDRVFDFDNETMDEFWLRMVDEEVSPAEVLEWLERWMAEKENEKE